MNLYTIFLLIDLQSQEEGELTNQAHVELLRHSLLKRIDKSWISRTKNNVINKYLDN